MRVARSLRGKIQRDATPDWSSLEDLLASPLCSQFTWMFKVDLEDGTRIDAYKHRWTRSYLHLSRDGRTYYVIWRDDEYDDASFREVEPDAAILAAFADSEHYGPTAAERAALRAAVRRARARRA